MQNIWWLRKNAILLSFGEVAEWSIAAVLKTVELRGSGGSNPSLSARPRSKKVSRNRYLLFLYLWRKFTCRRRCGNKRCRRAAFCAVGLQGPLRRAEGKGVKRSDQRERSSQFSLSALNSLQGVDFQPCRLFLCPKSCTKNAPTPFLCTSTGVFQIAHIIPYILSHFLIQPDSTECVV